MRIKVTSRPPDRSVSCDITASSLDSRFTHCLSNCHDNCLCIDLWIIRAKSQVRTRDSVDNQVCGNVDNTNDSRSRQVPEESLPGSEDPGLAADLTLSGQRAEAGRVSVPLMRHSR